MGEIDHQTGPQYPFLITPGSDVAAIRARADAVIRGISGMIYNLIRSSDHKMPDCDVDEVYIQVLEDLWLEILPKYNAWHKPFTSVNSYCFVCIRNRVSDIITARGRKKRQRIRITDPDHINNFNASPASNDAAIVKLADAIMAQPEQLFTRAEVRVLHALLANPGKPLKEIASIAGLKYQRNLSVTMKRMRRRLADVDIEHVQATFQLDSRGSAAVPVSAPPHPVCGGVSGEIRSGSEEANQSKGNTCGCDPGTAS